MKNISNNTQCIYQREEERREGARALVKLEFVCLLSLSLSFN